jgi:transaldolase
MNSLLQLKEHGQSIWLDHIARDFIYSGELKKVVDQGDISGVSINPAIVAKAAASDAASKYAELPHQGQAPATAFEKNFILDIRAASDALRPVYEKTHRRDGYVSLQTSMISADDAAETVAETRRLWREVDRENFMIKIPATEAAIPAITQLTGDGINIDVTLLFSRAMYERVAQAYLDGLEQLIARGGNPAGVASVASFFVSRIDTAVDTIITSHLNACGWIKIYNAVERESLRNLLGKVAIANAKGAYESYQSIFSGPRWESLTKQGAQKQRLLWASTGIENPVYRDVKYIEGLIGPDTVTAITHATLSAFKDHGRIRGSLQENMTSASVLLSTLKTLRISLDDIGGKLLLEGIKQSRTAQE